MEEADEFIKEACKHIECSFADEDDIQFSTPQIFEFLVRCIWRIDPTSKSTIPTYVYPNIITARLNLGNVISNYLQKFHIRGDTALHTVLYGNINNLRSAFIELIRKLPADATEIASQDQGQQFLENAFETSESQPKWVPVYCRGLNRKEEWILPDDQPETFPLSHFNKPAKHFDPRQWIAQYINSSHIDQSVKAKRPKPSLPPKPVFVDEQKNVEPVEEQVEVTEDVDENAALQAEYDTKLDEYKKLQDQRLKLEEKNKELHLKLSEWDPELIEAMEDPERYVAQVAIKIAELNRQMEEDTMILENGRREAAQKEMELEEEMIKMGARHEDMWLLEDIEQRTADMDRMVADYNQSNALKSQKCASVSMNDPMFLQKQNGRIRELDEVVRKQEANMMKQEEERAALRKQEERDSEAVNRSFAIIYNILLQHCDHYRGRLAMESFTRIHLYCMEILEMLRDNGALKQTVALLELEIFNEGQKQYDKQLELVNQDYQEVKELNQGLLAEIKLKDPDFHMPVV
ncbi:unnamed protein product [Caenorhabditis brenneri]